ncbi:MAG: hypothetical protein IPK83_10955 [Planctomycetes bacterium]|nr:hypothetical protein [Planctomycetota bacterium]
MDIETGAYTPLMDVLPPDFGVGYPAANDINDNDEIVGSRPGTYPIYRYGFVYAPATGLHILPFPGAGYQQYVSPASINNAGTVVGVISTVLASQHVFVYSAADGLRDLNDGSLIAGMPGGYRLYIATKINNQGWIVGYGHTTAGKITGYVLKPRSVPGDIDGDGDVDFADRELFMAVLLGADVDPTHATRSDLTQDGHMDGMDCQLFVAALLGA